MGKEKRLNKFLTKELLVELYINQKKIPFKIAKEMKCSHQSIRRRLRKFGVKIRNSSESHKGIIPHNFKGWKNHSGYILKISPNHPFKDKQNYVREHRLVMEKYLSRFLKSEEIVHHVNGIKNDNRIENLVLTNRKNHDTKSMIKILQKRIRYLEEKINKEERL